MLLFFPILVIVIVYQIITQFTVTLTVTQTTLTLHLNPIYSFMTRVVQLVIGEEGLLEHVLKSRGSIFAVVNPLSSPKLTPKVEKVEGQVEEGGNNTEKDEDNDKEKEVVVSAEKLSV